MPKNLFKKWLTRKSPGETILEVIVALLVIAMGAATATSLIITSIKANVFNKDSLIALNLGQEGLEFMHNLRDSNWLAYSADTQHCWNMPSSSSTCSSPFAGLIVQANPTDPTNKGFSLGTSLSAANTQKLDLSDGISGTETNYLINYYDLDTTVNSDGVGGIADDKDLMGSSVAGAGTGLVATTKYYRSIEVKYYTFGASPTWTLAAAASPQVADMMIVTSRVQWLDGTTAHEVSLSSALSRYK